MSSPAKVLTWQSKTRYTVFAVLTWHLISAAGKSLTRPLRMEKPPTVLGEKAARCGLVLGQGTLVFIEYAAHLGQIPVQFLSNCVEQELVFDG